MQYLCLVHIDPKLADVPESEDIAMTNESLDYDDELRRGGHYIASSPIQPAEAAAVVRVRNSKASVTDGPYAETHEQLGGFLYIEAKDMNEAVRLVSKVPVARWGSIEIRPKQNMQHK